MKSDDLSRGINRRENPRVSQRLARLSGSFAAMAAGKSWTSKRRSIAKLFGLWVIVQAMRHAALHTAASI